MTIAQSWTARVHREFHVANLTRGMRDVLLMLADYRGPGGIAWPSHATLASRAKCCVKTVQRAIAQACNLGLVEQAERRVRAGWRWLRTSNAYRFLSPPTPVLAGLRPRRSWKVPPATNGQMARGAESLSKKEALQQMLQAAAQGPDLLAMAQARFRARQMAEMAAR